MLAPFKRSKYWGTRYWVGLSVMLCALAFVAGAPWWVILLDIVLYTSGVIIVIPALEAIDNFFEERSKRSGNDGQ